MLENHSKLLSNKNIDWWQKASYIPFASNIKGAVEITTGLAITALATVAVPVSAATFAVTYAIDRAISDEDEIVLPWLTTIPLVPVALVPYALESIARGSIQQIPFVGNVILANYDIKQIKD